MTRAPMITRRLWLLADTGKAVLVGTENHHNAPSNRWLPRSQIVIVEKGAVPNPAFGTQPGVAQQLGVAITFEAPGWLLDDRGLVRDAEIPGEGH